MKWAVVLLVAVVAFFLMAEVDSLSCDRDGGTCTVAHRKIYRSAAHSFKVEDLIGACLAELPRTKPLQAEDTAGIRVVILTRRGILPLMNHATGLGIATMEEQADAVRRFVSDTSARRLEVEHTNGVVALCAAAFAFVFAGAIALASIR
jgi:hypothetical protein